MMLVRTRVAPSSIHGMGLFAVETIPKGTPVWRFEQRFDRVFSRDELAGLPADAQTHVHWFAYLDESAGGWVLSGDHTCFMNHALNPNTGAPHAALSPITTVALRDIAAGEELTCDYWSFDAAAAVKLESVRSGA